MKFICLLSFAALLVGSADSQIINTKWPDTTTSANVGLGISWPMAKMVIKNDAEGNSVPVLSIVSGTGAISGSGGAINFYKGDEWHPMGRVTTENIYTSGSDSKGKLILSSYYQDYKNELTLWNGNVGINTNNPQAQLHIDGPTSNVIKLTTTNEPGSYYSEIMNNYNSAESFAIRNMGSNILKASESGYESIELGNSINKNLILQTGGTGKIKIPNAQLMIGSVPDAQATNYKLAVNGNIICQKVKVTQSGWADYVFDPAYKLRPLEDVSSFIDQHKHLPDVPSASVVEQDGIDVGESQVTLLRKIEELTLYILELNKSLKLQQQIAIKQQTQIEALNKAADIR